MKEATQQKIQRQAELFMDSGEHVQAATNGSSSPWAYWLLGAVTYLGIGRAVLVTDKKVYVCKRTAAGLGSVIARYPRDSVKLDAAGPAAARRCGPDDLRPARTDQGRTRRRSGGEGALTQVPAAHRAARKYSNGPSQPPARAAMSSRS